jgi:L-ascorbate metabolism protein UlaG (beta-lactamase superfamily)
MLVTMTVMLRRLRWVPVAGLLAAGLPAVAGIESDTVSTPGGDVVLTFVGHGSLVFQFAGTTIHVDPFGRLADYAALPKADLVLLTHDHADHLDTAAIAKIRTAQTLLVGAPVCERKLPGATIMKNGETREFRGIGIEAVPAYNLVHTRSDGNPYHAKGEGNGYVLTLGNKRIYVAGDTENTPEMKSLREIDIAFLPMNLPYTMTPEMVADAARAFRPSILYPYHYGKTDVSRLSGLLKDEKGIEVRVRKLE